MQNVFHPSLVIAKILNHFKGAEKFKSIVCSETKDKFLAMSPSIKWKKLNLADIQWQRTYISTPNGGNNGEERNRINVISKLHKENIKSCSSMSSIQGKLW